MALFDQVLLRQPIKNVRSGICRRYAAAGYPLLPLTRLLRAPLRWFYHRSPLLRHDSKRHLKPRLLIRLHELCIQNHPRDFTIYLGQLKFRSYGSEMSVQGYYVGEIEYHLVQFVVGRLVPGFVMFDVGAHHGLFTLVVAHELKKKGWLGHVFSFEPSPQNFALLKHNVEQNDLGTFATLSPEAVAEQCGTSTLLVNTRENSDNRLGLESGGSTGTMAEGLVAQPVAVTNLDRFLGHVGRVDLIKIDVQGHEPSVLAGAVGLIERYRPILVVEAVQEWEGTSRIRDFLVGHGYRIHGLDARGRLCPPNGPDAFVSWDWVGTPE